MAFTKEQIEKLGIAFEEGMTDDQVLEAISKMQGELKAQKEKAESEAKTNKGLVDKYSSEIASLKDEAKARLTDDEKKALEVQEMKDKIASLEKEKSISEKTAKYIKLGYGEEIAKQVAEGEINGKDVSDLHEQFLKAHDEALKKQLMKGNPDPSGADDTKKTWTKEDFKAGKISLEEMNKIKVDDPALYQTLIS